MSASKILALTSLFLATALAQTEWKEFTSSEGNFRVLFPDNPQQQTDAERNLHQFSATAGAESYGLEYADPAYYTANLGYCNVIHETPH